MSKTIALTIGDPNGIGPEIAVKAAAALLGNADIRVVVVGDEHVIRHYGERCAPAHQFRHFRNDALSRDAIPLHPVDALPATHFRPARSMPPQAARRLPMWTQRSVLFASAQWMRSSAARIMRHP